MIEIKSKEDFIKHFGYKREELPKQAEPWLYEIINFGIDKKLFYSRVTNNSIPPKPRKSVA